MAPCVPKHVIPPRGPAIPFIIYRTFEPDRKDEAFARVTGITI